MHQINRRNQRNWSLSMAAWAGKIRKFVSTKAEMLIIPWVGRQQQAMA